MSDVCMNEIDNAVRHAAQSGETLFVATVAKRIAGLCGGSPQSIAKALTQAGIKAGVTMQFGRPE
jgi:hypothetical protein